MAQEPKLQPYTFDAEKYDQIIIGFPVWASRIAPPIRTFVEDNKSVLRKKSISAFACQAGSGGEKALSGLKNLLSIENFEATMILIDPKEKPSNINDGIIKDFCGEV